MVLMCCLAAATVMAQPKKGQPASNKITVPGFRDIPWGEHIDSISSNGKKLVFLKSDAMRDQSAYYLEGEDMVIGTVNLNSVFYYFTDRGRFTKVLLVADKKYFPDMRYILTNKFEDPQGAKVLNGNNVYQWNVDDVKITLTDGSADGQMTVTFFIDYNYLEFKKINSKVDDF